MENNYFDPIKPYICGFSSPTISDVIAFCAIMPLHKDFLKQQATIDKLPRLCRWFSKVSENEDIVTACSELKDQGAAKL